MSKFRHLPLIAALHLAWPAGAALAEPAATASTGAAGATTAVQRVDLLEFVVEGNTVLPQIEVERAVYPLLGPGRTATDIEKARAALEAAYQQAGYLSVGVVVPPQSVQEGVVKLQVVEGKVDRLKVSGNRYTLRSQLRDEVPELASGKVPHFPTMQAELAEAGRSPDRRVTPLLRPGTRPGTMEVELAVEDALPLHGNMEVNNRKSPDTTDTRLEAGIRYDNLFQRRHSAGLNYVVSPEKTSEVSVLSAYYSLPTSPGRSLTGFVQYSNNDLATAVGTAVVGKGVTAGLRYSITLPAPPGVPNFFHSLSLGVDYKNLKETQNTLGFDAKDSPLRYTPLVAQYTAGHFADDGDITGNLGIVVNPGSSRDVDCQGVRLDQFECRRFSAPADFGVLRGDLGMTHRFAGWELLGKFDFQATGDALVSPEQFLAGGIDTVRGYLEGEAAGDAGWRLRFEAKSPPLLELGATPLRGLIFIEGAYLQVNDALPGQEASFRLAGAGLGLRLKGTRGGPLFAFDLAQALRDGPSTERGKFRGHFRLGYEF
jgi:hemolysin activation/secretion protein